MDTVSNPDHGQAAFAGRPNVTLNPADHPAYPAHPGIVSGHPADPTPGGNTAGNPGEHYATDGGATPSTASGPRFLGPPVHIGDETGQHQGGGDNGGHIPVDIPPPHPGGGGGGGGRVRANRGVVRGSNTDKGTGESGGSVGESVAGVKITNPGRQQPYTPTGKV